MTHRAREGASPPRTRVAVGVITYRRPQGLERLLEGLGRLELGDAPPELRVVVVDNDPGASARSVCERWRSVLPWPLHYQVEPRRGIPFARNRTVEIALRQEADFLAFIDDDEVPEPQWLQELLRVQRAYAADVVAGPVLPRFESTVPRWIQEGGFFHRPRFSTGTRMPHVATGNLLIGAHVLRGTTPPFDPRRALSGGEDTLFSLRIAAAGHALVWADEARVHETVPAQRATARWLLQRAYRRGNGWSLCERDTHCPPRVVVLRCAKGLARVVQGALMLPVAALAGRAHLLRAGQTLLFGVGNVTGILGLQYQEYTRPGEVRPHAGLLRELRAHRWHA